MDFAENAPHLSVHCVMPGFISTNIALLSTIRSWKLRNGGQEPPKERVDRWAKQLDGFTNNTEGIGLPAPDAAEIIINGQLLIPSSINSSFLVTRVLLTACAGVEDGLFGILVGDDAVALDKGVRSQEIGAFYPLTKEEVSNVGRASLRLAQLGDPTYCQGRQTQLANRAAATKEAKSRL